MASSRQRPSGNKFRRPGDRRILHVTDVRHAGGHRLDLLFSDVVRKTVDVEPLLVGPVFEPLRRVDFFAAVTLDEDETTVAWPNGADLAPEALHALPAVAETAALAAAS